MAKNSGHTREVTIVAENTYGFADNKALSRKDLESLFTENNERKEYWELSESKQKVIDKEINRIVDIAMQSLGNKKEIIEIENGTVIEVQFVKKRMRHIVRNLFRQLSGRILSEKDIVEFNEIVKRSKFIEKQDNTSKNNAKDYFLVFKDEGGTELYIKVAHEPRQGNGKQFYPYHIDVRLYRSKQ